MAGTSVIDAYVDDLRRLLRRTRDAEQILTEVQDHLVDTIERLQREGLHADDAAAEAVRRFGPVAPLGRALRDTHVDAAVPTRFTRLAGATATSLPVAVALSVLVATSHVTGTSLSWLGAASGGAVVSTFVIAVVGLHRRHGATAGKLGRIGITVFALSPGLALPFGYAAGAALAVISSLALTILAVAWWRANVLRRPAVAAVAALPPLGVVGMALGSLLGFDMHRVAVVPAALLAVAIAVIGSQLWREEPLDARVPRPPTPA